MSVITNNNTEFTSRFVFSLYFKEILIIIYLLGLYLVLICLFHLYCAFVICRFRLSVNAKMLIINNLLFILLLHAQLHSKARTGCGLNVDSIKKRRIEAIRGQILSKLGLNELPNNNGSAPSNLRPSNIEETYNRTRDFLLEQARVKKQECNQPEENYFAQDIVIITSTNPTNDNQPGKISVK